MKASVNLGRVTVEVEAPSVKELFAEIASVSEVFGERACGLCGCEELRFQKRHVSSGKKELDFFEMVCTSGKCRAKLAFGTMQDGETLFPKRKLNRDNQPDNENGTYGPHRGWHRYQPQGGPTQNGQQQEAAPAGQRSRPPQTNEVPF